MGVLKGLGGFWGWFWGCWGDLGRGPDVVSGSLGGWGVLKRLGEVELGVLVSSGGSWGELGVL